MKKIVILFALMPALALLFHSCGNGNTKKGTSSPDNQPEGVLVIGRDIITDIIVRPDTLGDPWEVEKVKGYEGAGMFEDLFSKIYSGKLKVYDVLDEKLLTPQDVREITEKFNSDPDKIAKFQFLEDWYYNPSTSAIEKRIRSVSFGYEVIRDGGLPPGYFPLFRLKME